MIKYLFIIILTLGVVCLFANSDITYKPRLLKDAISYTKQSLFISHGYSGVWKSSKPNLFSAETSGKLYFKAKNNSKFSLLFFKSPSEMIFLNSAPANFSVNTLTFEGQFEVVQNQAKIQYCDGKSNFTLNGQELTGNLQSQNCGFLFEISLLPVNPEDLQEPIVSYSFLISCISVALIFAYSKHAQDCINSEASARKTSIYFLLLQSASDLFFALWHLYLATVYFRAFDYLILAAFMSFAVYLVIHGRLMMAVWMAQNSQYAQEGIEILRIKYSIFESYSLILITSFIPLVMIFSDYLIWIVIFSHSYLAQIISNARNGHKNSLKASVIVVITTARLVLLLYLFGCPANFRGILTDYKNCLILTGFFAGQLGILLVQNSRPKFFLPKICRPKVYSYFREVEEEKSTEESECIICMTALNLSGHESQEIINFARTMHTPCRHMFHEDCLNNWMAVKMECPTCRSSLPLIEE